MSHEGLEKYAFKMTLNPGQAEEYKRRHDEIWPELADLLHEAGVSDYSIFLDEETNTLFGVMWRRKNHEMASLPGSPRDAKVVGLHGRHHGDQRSQRAAFKGPAAGLSHGLGRWRTGGMSP